MSSMDTQEIIRYPSYYVVKGVDEVPYTIKNLLAKWNAAYFRLEEIGYVYDPKMKELRIPRGFSEQSLLAAFPDSYIKDCDPIEYYPKIDVSLTNAPRDFIQEHVLAFMLGASPYEIVRGRSQIYTDLDTGKGKTYLMIATACYFKARMVVITPPIKKVTDQWADSISSFTSLNRSEYMVVQGSEACEEIIEGKHDKVKFFIIPRSTILAFVRKYENRWDMATILFDAMKVNIKAIDEAHMDFHTCVCIDCYTNIPKTYYMSSSPGRSEKKENLIYDKVFENVVRYGKKLVTKEQKHIIPVIMQFKSTPTEKQLKAIKTRYGTSLSKYGDYLLDPDGARDEFLDAYTYSLYWLLKFRRDNGKILVLCITVDFATQLRDYTKKVFPFLSTGLYVGTGKEKVKELNNDIIFSTKQSMGTGAEIKNHQMTINTITYSSDILADQIPGRIREQHNRKGIYLEIVNIAHKIARKHYLEREPYLIKKAKNGKLMVHVIDDNDLRSMDYFFDNRLRFNSNGLQVDENNNVHIHMKK